MREVAEGLRFVVSGGARCPRLFMPGGHMVFMFPHFFCIAPLRFSVDRLSLNIFHLQKYTTRATLFHALHVSLIGEVAAG